jgi:hypothetical protein
MKTNVLCRVFNWMDRNRYPLTLVLIFFLTMGIVSILSGGCNPW